MDNVTDVMVVGLTWCHQGRSTILRRVFRRGGCRWFWCFWHWYFYMCCLGSYIYFFLCYSSFCGQNLLSDSLIMVAVRECIFLVGGLETKYYNTSWWVSDMLSGVLKIGFFRIFWWYVWWNWIPWRSLCGLFYSCMYIFYK